MKWCCEAAEQSPNLDLYLDFFILVDKDGVELDGSPVKFCPFCGRRLEELLK